MVVATMLVGALDHLMVLLLVPDPPMLPLPRCEATEM